MTWNYRVLRHIYTEETWLAIHEVYYDDDNNPDCCTVDPIEPGGETLEELKSDLEHISKACEKPILDYDFFTSFKTKDDKL